MLDDELDGVALDVMRAPYARRDTPTLPGRVVDSREVRMALDRMQQDDQATAESCPGACRECPACRGMHIVQYALCDACSTCPTCKGAHVVTPAEAAAYRSTHPPPPPSLPQCDSDEEIVPEPPEAA